MRIAKHLTLNVVVVACLLASVNRALAGDFENKIVSFAAARVGQKVGDRGSTRLVEQAFAAADAKHGRNLQWGSTDKISALYRGDIVQFRQN